ncbi:MAG: UbiA family prenyltransferase [Sphingobacteriales bacterium]|nr:UbiA family prenyltransferase [Sphingobacteriales bacterium]MBI3717969.1 UbiA family prenyltransferase [Sphingobacteriales bacterium]
MKKITNVFLFSSAFITLCALAMVAQTADLFQLQNLNPFYFFFTAGGTMASYNLHWYLTDTNVSNEISERYTWTHTHKQLLLPFAGIGMLMSLISFYFLIHYWLWIITGAIVAGLYTAPKIPGKVSTFLRKIAIAKTIYLALAWTYVTAVLPLIISRQHINFHSIAFILHRYFFIYALCILFDYRDRDEDIGQGIRSLITMLNEKGIKVLFYVSLVSGILMALFFYGIYSPSLKGILLCIPLLILAMLYNSIKKNKNDYLYYFAIDGLMLLSFLLTSFQQLSSFLWQ